MVGNLNALVRRVMECLINQTASPSCSTRSSRKGVSKDLRAEMSIASSLSTRLIQKRSIICECNPCVALFTTVVEHGYMGRSQKKTPSSS